jgi:hypothetical protein
MPTHRLEDSKLSEVVARLSEAAMTSESRDEHFREIVMNVLLEHAMAFEEEVRQIKIREARFDAIEIVVCEMLGCSEDEIPKSIAALQARNAELEA